ncbi:hypothetical protein PS624_01213 [Pseudomonas fluorescens]|uniref:Uncharacterized protein n=1 Tax=Pseudomonas fluorescens TaxID=294 RepID=A0A5E6QXY2_PSEFL|nr:hypothetical protein PS624_01213 [Pseudomonas fluorescens]VVQ37981.1 hypothetical protein PS947_05893 [Pseudomonas fluorescens]
MDSSVFEQTEFLLRATVAGAGGLTQQILTDATIPCVATLTAHQLPKTALRSHHTFSCRLLEEAASKVLGIMTVAQARAVEQPLGDANSKSLGRGNRRRL